MTAPSLRPVRRLAFAALALLAGAAAAAGPVPPDVLRGEILTGWRAADGTHMAGLRLTLAPGWKTYWRAPGEAGIPPRFDWSGSDNLAGVAPRWPRPVVFDQSGMRSIGYRGGVVLPLAVTPARSGRAVVLRGRVALGVCKDICVPVSLRISGTLPADRPGSGAAAIRAALGKLPEAGSAAGVSNLTCRVAPISDGLRLTARMEVPRLGDDEVAVIETGDPQVWVAPTQTTRNGASLTAVTDLVAPEGRPFALDRSDLRITLLAGDRAVAIDGCGGAG